MTYLQLLEKLKDLPENLLKQNVIYYNYESMTFEFIQDFEQAEKIDPETNCGFNFNNDQFLLFSKSETY